MRVLQQRGGLSFLGGKDRIHVHQRHFSSRKAYADLLWWGTGGIPSDVWSDVKYSSLCSSLL